MSLNIFCSNCSNPLNNPLYLGKISIVAYDMKNHIIKVKTESVCKHVFCDNCADLTQYPDHCKLCKKEFNIILKTDLKMPMILTTPMASLSREEIVAITLCEGTTMIPNLET